jgi:hypothetical protein
LFKFEKSFRKKIQKPRKTNLHKKKTSWYDQQITEGAKWKNHIGNIQILPDIGINQHLLGWPVSNHHTREEYAFVPSARNERHIGIAVTNHANSNAPSVAAWCMALRTPARFHLSNGPALLIAIFFFGQYWFSFFYFFLIFFDCFYFKKFNISNFVQISIF